MYLFATPIIHWRSMQFWRNILVACIPSLFMNVYITGLNQLTDIEIDKINKPYLPLASNELTIPQGVFIVFTSLLLSFLFGIKASWPLRLTLLSSFFFGTIYSLPGLRLKRFPFLAALCIIVVMGAVVNLGFYVSIRMSSTMQNYFKKKYNSIFKLFIVQCVNAVPTNTNQSIGFN